MLTESLVLELISSKYEKEWLEFKEKGYLIHEGSNKTGYWKVLK